MDIQNFVFPYKWNQSPVLNELMVALIQRDFVEAKKNIMQLDEFICTARGSGLRSYSANPKFATFKRCLYEFLCNYDTMKFLVDNGFRINKFTQIVCSDGLKDMGIIGRAYCANKDTRIVELLLSAGFTVYEHGGFIGNNHVPMWKAVMVYNFDREIIDLMLAYGQSVNDLLDEIKFSEDDPNYKPWAADYLRSRPNVIRKGGLNNNISYQYSENRYAQYDTNTNASNDTKSLHASREGCYIATAVYGGYDTAEVLVLRKFRDEVLNNSFIGRIFIKLYYALSPKIAVKLKQHDRINGKVKCLLDKFVEHLTSKM